MNRIKPTPNDGHNRIKMAAACCCRRSAFAATALVLLAGILGEAWAVDIRMAVQPVWLTVSVNSSNTTKTAIGFTITTNGLTTVDGTGTNWICDPISVSATCPANPAGLTLVITDLSTNVITSFSPLIPTNGSSVTLTNWLWLKTTNVPGGTYPCQLDASGPGTGLLRFTVQSAYIWGGYGATNVANGGSLLWSEPTNWVGGNLPGDGAEVVLGDRGALNSANTNMEISADVTIGSLRDSITGSSSLRYNIQLDPGVTLRITNQNGVSLGLRDRSDTTREWYLDIFGTNASVVVDNTNATFATYSLANNTASTWYMDRLGTFSANVSMFRLSDYLSYPNFTNYVANGYAAATVPVNSAPCGEIKFARTNIIICSHQADPTTWTNPSVRDFSFVMGRNYLSGTTTRKAITLGLYNYWEADSMLWAGYGMTMDSGGNWVFGMGTNSVLILRGRNGGTNRVAMMDLGDFANPGKGTTTVKLTANLSGGGIDALVDKLWVGRDSTNNGTGGGRGTAELDTGRGTFDVNDVILGFQGQGNNGGTTEDYAWGVLKVNNGGLFKVNGAIDLGYTTADATNNSTATDSAKSGYGQITVSGGATLSANVIRLGGVTKLSWNNNLTVSGSGSRLIVSNTIAGSDKRLNSLTMSSGGALQLFIDGNNSAAYAYTTNLSIASGCFIRVADIKNVTYTDGSAQFPLISYTAGTPTIPGVIMPGDFTGSGTVIPNGAFQLDLYVSTNPPNTNLIWRGPAGTANWDTGTKNWYDPMTGLMTNFHNGDWVTFDDTPGYATNINQTASILLPGQVLMSNVNLSYKFTGSGVQGGGVFKKLGTGVVEVGGSLAIPVALSAGQLTNNSSGSVAGVAASAGTILDNAGTISAGLISAGTTTVYGSGVINGSVTIQSGAAMVNYGNVNGVPTLQAGSTMWNSNQITYNLGGTMNVASNATFINAGYITGDNITVSGTFKDMGLGTISLYNQLLINPYALFIPGGDGIGSTDVEGIGSATFSGRVTLLSNSTNLFKVNLDSGDNYTILYSGDLDFGGSQGTPAYNGATIVITNTGLTPITAGKSFGMFQNAYIRGVGGPLGITGAATNSYPVLNPAVPGAQLAWNINDIVHNGVISIIAVNTNMPNLTVSSQSIVLNNIYTAGTNSNGSFKYATNNVVFTHLSWPTNHTGWRLQQQNNDLNIGLTTNWSTVFGSPWISDVVNSNNLIKNQATFFRLVFP